MPLVSRRIKDIFQPRHRSMRKVRADSVRLGVEKLENPAVTGFDETKADLLNNIGGNYQYLSDSAGLIATMNYYTSMTAGETRADGVAGYTQSTALQHGELGAFILQSTTQYYQHTGGGRTVDPVAKTIRYRNENGTGAETTTFTYTWFVNSTRLASTTESLPIVTSAQNGPGTADQNVTVYDVDGHAIWLRDGGGFITRMAYDEATGAMIQRVADVNTALTSDEPTGWITPAGGGLHLITTLEVDFLGRDTKITDPLNHITYMVYKDAAHETRTYAGWNTSTNKPTLPIQVSREDRPGSYYETFTMSATPTVSGGRPTAQEAVSSLQTLSRGYISAGGQLVENRNYFDFTGMTYGTAPVLGLANVNFYLSQLGYDHRGRQNKTVSPTGTIQRTEYDGRNRVASTWVGTDDVPDVGFWSPTNLVGTDMTQTSSYVYDNGGIGDDNLTQMTAIVGGGAPDRVTVYAQDWRNRVVVTKGGVQASEASTVQRPINYTEYDNLSQAIANEYYDADNVNIVDANNDGVPD
jgi:hypothetical protein